MRYLVLIETLLLLCEANASGPWNGHAAAFSFSSDDGNIDNLGWAQVFEDFGYNFTIFIVTDWVGNTNKLTWEDILYLNSLGDEIASHSVSHKRLLTDSAFVIEYIGQAPSCSLCVFNDSLKINSSFDYEDTVFALSDSSVFYLVDLVSTLNDLENITCSLIYYPDSLSACESSNLRETCWVDIREKPFLAKTTSGVSMDTLLWETRHSKEVLEQEIRAVDPTYNCLSFAYPYHSHELRTMIVLRDSASYIAARDGYKGGYPKPWAGRDGRSTWDTVTLYEVPTDAVLRNIVGPNNSFPEDTTRAIIRAKIQEWKENHTWANFYSHRYNCTWEPLDTTHLRWILDEIQNDGDVWVAPFGVVAEYVRQTHFCYDGWHWVSWPPLKKNELLIDKVDTVSLLSNFDISFNISSPTSMSYKIAIFDCTGRSIKSFKGVSHNGKIRFFWDGKDSHQNQVMNGIYFMLLEAKQKYELKKILFVHP